MILDTLVLSPSRRVFSDVEQPLDRRFHTIMLADNIEIVVNNVAKGHGMLVSSGTINPD